MGKGGKCAKKQTLNAPKHSVRLAMKKSKEAFESENKKRKRDQNSEVSGDEYTDPPSKKKLKLEKSNSASISPDTALNTAALHQISESQSSLGVGASVSTFKDNDHEKEEKPSNDRKTDSGVDENKSNSANNDDNDVRESDSEMEDFDIKIHASTYSMDEIEDTFNSGICDCIIKRLPLIAPLMLPNNYTVQQFYILLMKTHYAVLRSLVKGAEYDCLTFTCTIF